MPTRGTLRHSSFLVRYSIFMKEGWARPTLQVVTLMRPFLNQARKFRIHSGQSDTWAPPALVQGPFMP